MRFVKGFMIFLVLLWGLACSDSLSSDSAAESRSYAGSGGASSTDTATSADIGNSSPRQEDSATESSPSIGNSTGSDEFAESDDDGTSAEESLDDPTAGEEVWIQFSPDDSTSMASAQFYKLDRSVGHRNLKPHEFVNYYDAPKALYDQEEWAYESADSSGIGLALKATRREIESAPQVDCEVGEDCAEAESNDGFDLLFQMNGDQITTDIRRNWHLVMCVDVSGSMSGDKIEFVRKALVKMLQHLKEGDHLTLVTFDSSSHVIFENKEFSESENDIREAFEALRPGSATNMLAGLNEAYRLAQAHYQEGMLHRVLLFGDGRANVGNTDIERFAGLTRREQQEGIYLSGFGVGYDYDWERMDQLTDAGKGAHVFLPNLDEVELMFGDYFSKMVEVAADEISIAMTFPPGIRLESFSGEEVSTDRENRVQNIILAKGDDLTFLARLLVSDDEAWDKPATLEIEYRPLGTAELVTQKVQFEKLSEILKPEGQLMQRTQAVVDFADYACGTGSDTEAKRTLENYETNHTLDWGLEEIQSLLR